MHAGLRIVFDLLAGELVLRVLMPGSTVTRGLGRVGRLVAI